MTSFRLWWIASLAALVTVAGCSGRGTANTTDAMGVMVDAGSDAALVAHDAGSSIDAAAAQDGGADAPAPHLDANFDAGCAAPVCTDLPSNCHYDSSLEPCRCGMIVCDPPATPCSPACGARSFCEYPADTCGASGGGACTPVPDVCIDLFDPVCGCDGHTYSNACQAEAASQSIAFHGPCATPTDCRTTGCPSGSSCMTCRGSGPVCLSDGTVC